MRFISTCWSLRCFHRITTARRWNFDVLSSGLRKRLVIRLVFLTVICIFGWADRLHTLDSLRIGLFAAHLKVIVARFTCLSLRALWSLRIFFELPSTWAWGFHLFFRAFNLTIGISDNIIPSMQFAGMANRTKHCNFVAFLTTIFLHSFGLDWNNQVWTWRCVHVNKVAHYVWIFVCHKAVWVATKRLYVFQKNL